MNIIKRKQSEKSKENKQFKKVKRKISEKSKK